MNGKDSFLKALGMRIRTLRTASGSSIEQLAGRSELSPRFLSEIEAGRGNVSVARLHQLAHALEQPIQNLLPAAQDDISLPGRLWALLESCQPKDLEELHAWLSARQKKPIARSIALVGVRGAGKSTIGKRLAERLGLSFVEFDALIEKEAGLSLTEIFRVHGEDYYRKLERGVMEKFLAQHPHAVLATGGSLVTASETWSLVKRECHTVWLKASPKDHWDRVVAQGDTRPIANPGARDELKALLKTRQPLYQQSEMVIDTSHHTIDESIELIVKRLHIANKQASHDHETRKRPEPRIKKRA